LSYEDYRPDMYLYKFMIDNLINLSALRNINAKNIPSKDNTIKMLETNFTVQSKIMSEAIRRAKKMMDKRIEALSNAGYEVAYVNAELRSPGLTGMGSGLLKLIFEVGLSIDPILGLPFYPASTIKGIARHSFLQNFNLGIDECKEKAEELTDTIFGKSPGGSEDRGHISLVTFLDAYPIGCAKEECSVYTGGIVTPHYYQGGEPVDTEMDAQPVPVPHLLIAPGLVFRFVLGVRKKPYPEEVDRVLSKAKDITNNNCSNALKLESSQDILRLVALALMKELRGGSFARGKKGYNVFEPTNVLRDKFAVKAFGFWY